MRRNHELRPLPRKEIRAETMHARLAAVLRNPYFQGCPGVEMPDLGGIDLVPARNLAGVEKKINQRRDGPTPRIPRRIAKGLTEIAALRMRLQIEQADDFGGAPARDGINRHFISIRMASLKSSGAIASEEPGSRANADLTPAVRRRITYAKS